MSLDRNIWHSRISVGTKLCLYNSCILPIYLYGVETWAVTATAAKTFDALDQWCLRRILNIHWTEHITNNEVRSRTQQPLLSDAVHSRHLRLFGHICRADPVRIILRHCMPVLPVCPSTEGEDPAGRDRLLTNYREWSMATQSGSDDSSTACSEQNSLADTHGNGYVADKLRMMMMTSSVQHYMQLCINIYEPLNYLCPKFLNLWIWHATACAN